MALKRITPEEALKLGLLDGKPGVQGEQGIRGPEGVPGRPGLDGKDGLSIQGERGERGMDGADGTIGKDGVGIDGEQGDKGEQGDMPGHEWRGTMLRFELPDGEMGRFVELRGRDGIGGGASGGSAIARLRQLLDTDVSAPNDTDVLTYDSASSTWIAAAAAGGGDPWHEFVGQSSNPGTIAADTLYQDDGTNFDAGTLVWGDLSNPMLIGENFSVGNPGTEQGGINVNGTTYDAVQKINSVGGSLDASLILHRHSTSFPANLTFARSNDETIGHTAVTAGQTYGSMIFTGWTGTHYDIGAVIDARVPAGGTISPTSAPGELAFFTTPDGSNGSLLAMTIEEDQNVAFAGSTSGIDHGDLAGLLDDDHTQYALLAGRSGGQTLIGGTGAGDDLTLVGTSGALATSRVNMNTPVEFGAYQPTGAAYGFNYAATETFGNFVGGGLNFSGTINFTGTTFIYESFRGAPTITSNAVPGFAAYTVLQALPRFEAGSVSTHNPLAPLIVNAGPRINNGFSGTRTTATAAAINFAPTIGATVSGAVMNVTSVTGLIVAPKYSTVAGSTISFGTVRGVHIQNPAAGLFQPGSGTENITAYIGMDVNNISFGGASVVKAALRSAMTASSVNTWFLLNNGNAHSDHGGGHIYFDDNAGIAYGGVSNNSFDIWQTWNGAGNYFRTFFSANNDSLRWSNPGSDRFLFDNDGGNTTGEYNFNCAKFSLGANAGAVGNQVGNFVAGIRSTQVGGEWADFLLTQAANLTVDHAMGGVFGWAINAPSMTIGTGSVTTAGALSVAGNVNQGSVNRFGIRVLSNPTGGSGVNAALWITAGRSRFDGIVDINNGDALGGGAGATLGTIGGTGPTAAAQAQWVQIEVNGVNHWIPAWT